MIRGKKTTLRALEDRDIELLRRWRNHPELMKYHCSDIPVSEPDQKRWYQNYNSYTGSIIFIIESDDGTPVGYTIIKHIDHKNRQAEIGLYLDPEQQGKGYGKDAFSTLMKYGFHELNMHRLYLEVFAFNDRAIQMYERLGFQTEGRKRKSYFTQNQFQDIIVMSILENEFTG